MSLSRILEFLNETKNLSIICVNYWIATTKRSISTNSLMNSKSTDNIHIFMHSSSLSSYCYRNGVFCNSQMIIKIYNYIFGSSSRIFVMLGKGDLTCLMLLHSLLKIKLVIIIILMWGE